MLIVCVDGREKKIAVVVAISSFGAGCFVLIFYIVLDVVSVFLRFTSHPSQLKTPNPF